MFLYPKHDAARVRIYSRLTEVFLHHIVDDNYFLLATGKEEVGLYSKKSIPKRSRGRSRTEKNWRVKKKLIHLRKK